MNVNPKPALHSPLVRNFFFWTGIVATLAYRIINLLTQFNPLWAQISWYVGTIGFILYFVHRYQISEKRAALIAHHNLVEKSETLTGLTEDDREAMRYILATLTSTKEKWNYIFIFSLSALTLLIGVYTDVIAKW